jgi:hypothetical protein
MKPFFARIMPFIFLGIIIVIFIAGFVIFSYLLIFGALVGLFLFCIAWIKELIFKHKNSYPEVKKPRSGRTIDHEK